MIIFTHLPKDDQGNIKPGTPSGYRPNKKAILRTNQVLQDFAIGFDNMHKKERLFNDMSVVERMNTDQRSFNGYIPPASTDPDESWKSQAFRPIVRNKTISIAAHITGSLIYPLVNAQNQNDQEDKEAAQVMRDLHEWAAETSNGGQGYEKTFLNSVIGGIVNPAVIVHSEYAETYRTIKEVQPDGTWKEKEVLDEALSGFLDTIVPVDELYIADNREEDVQKQAFLLRRRTIDFTIAEGKYGQKPNFKFVRPGVQVLYSGAADTFYEADDKDLSKRQVEEIIYWNRADDVKLVFVNGVLMDDPDQPNPRQDKRYPFSKSGYETFATPFFYYKSLPFKMGPDEEVINKAYRMLFDGGYLAAMPPSVYFGSETITSSVNTPGKITMFQDEKGRFEPLGLKGDMNATQVMLDRAEASLNESSNSPRQSGQEVKGEQTAFEVSREEQNAKVMLGLFGKMVGFLVKEFGQLRTSDVLQFLTVGEVNQITDGLKFKTFLLSDKTVNGKTKARKIQFSADMPDEPVTEDYLLDQSFRIQEEEGDDVQLFKVNPTLFRQMKFKIKVTPEVVTPPSDNVRKALNLEAYTAAINNPYANQEALYRDLLLGSYDATKGDTDKYVLKPEQMMQPGLGQMLGAQPGMGPMAGALANPGKAGGMKDLISKSI